MASFPDLNNGYGAPAQVGNTSSTTLFLIFLWVGFEGFWAGLLPIPHLNFVTHFIFLVAFCSVLLKSTKRNSISQGLLCFALTVPLLICVSVLGSHSRGALISLVAILLYLKIAYVFILAKHIRIERLSTLLTALAVIHILGVLASFLFYDFFFNLQNRDGIDPWRRILGLQLNPNALAFFSASLAVYFLFIKRRLALAAVLIGTLIWSGSRSAVLFFSICSMYLGWVDGRVRGKAIVFVALIVAGLGAGMSSQRSMVTLEQVDRAINSGGNYVRAAMMAGGYRLALQNFPFGSGGGTFGSPLGTDLPAYEDASIANLPKIQNGGGDS